MQNAGISPSRHGLQEHGLHDLSVAYWNLGTAQLMEKAIQRHEGMLSGRGALVVRTGQFTGRSPKDKYIVRDATTESSIHWGNVNQPLTPQQFDGIHAKLAAHWKGGEAFVEDLFAGADPEFMLRVRVISQFAWHGLFARQLFIRPNRNAAQAFVPDFTILFAPGFQCDPAADGTRSETCIAINFEKRLVIIAGTCYAGEMKKSVFTILNYLLPARGVMPMHCSANMADSGKVALFFGLSGTGKTTLSADRHRRLIGDDEHGWSDRGVFNFEGGCYAKCIRLSRDQEPQIYNAIRYGAVLENVAIDPDTRRLDFNSEEWTENTRAAYRVHFIENAQIPGVGGHPTEVIFLTADAFGVLPPIARLTPEQAMYHFLSGYTAKLAGTERGLGKEPSATFSACFGEPFLPRHPLEYARMLGEKLRRHNAQVWLVNTGWSGGPYGVGQRMNLAYTRAMVNAVLDGDLNHIECVPHPLFKVHVPVSCPGVPSMLLDPRNTWQDKEAYDRAAADLAARFRKNFEKFGSVGDEIRGSGPGA